jgi:GNAT superfamily N-acetyltransferase
VTTDLIDCRRMAGPERFDVQRVMRAFRSDEQRLNAALTLFTDREDYGFVWLAYRDDTLAGCCSVGYTIGTAAGGVTAIVRDLYVVPAARRLGVASTMIESLRGQLAALEIVRIEIASTGDPGLLAFLAARGFAVTAGLFSAAR